MSESISQTFLMALMPVRNALFQAVLTRVDPASVDGSRPEKTWPQAEDLLRKAIRKVFQQYAASRTAPDQTTSPVLPQALADQIVAELGEAAPVAENAVLVAPSEDEAMPAAVWARLAAAIQVDAAKLPGGKLLNPDSVLHSPDPLLAPKKPRTYEDPRDGEVLSPASRFAAIAVMALVLGVALTIYLVRRPPPKPELAPTAQSMPANPS